MKREREDKFSDLECEKPMIVMDGGLRRVLPYWFTFSLNVKQRMMGKSVLEAMHTEFNVSSESYYRAAIADGRIRLNGERVSESVLLKGHDVITHRVHRHEPPVMLYGSSSVPDLSRPIQIVAETESFLAVNKPASVPVHPTGLRHSSKRWRMLTGFCFYSGRYRHNTLVEMLALTHGKLFPANRLDRLTSGVMVLCKSSEAARRRVICSFSIFFFFFFFFFFF